MKVKIDTSLCEGHAKCMEATEVVFEVRDDDLSHVLVDTVPPEEEANVTPSRPNVSESGNLDRGLTSVPHW